MGNFAPGTNLNAGDVISFLNDIAKTTSYPWVINDLIVGDPQGTSPIERNITVKQNSSEFDGSFNVVYTVGSKVDIDTVLSNKILYDTNNTSTFLSNPSASKVIQRIGSLNPNVRLNQIDIDPSTFGYDSGTDSFKVKIVPTPWSSVYTGSAWVYWKSALVVQFSSWPTSTVYGYSNCSVTLSLSKTTTGSVSYTFDDGSTSNTSFQISGTTLTLKTGQSANTTAYTCKVKATISNDPTYGTGSTSSSATSVTIGKASMSLGDITVDGSTTAKNLTVGYATQNYTLAISSGLPTVGTNSITYSIDSTTSYTGQSPASNLSITNNQLILTNGLRACSFRLTIKATVVNSSGNYLNGSVSTGIIFYVKGKINNTPFTTYDMTYASCSSNSEYPNSSSPNANFAAWRAFDDNSNPTFWSTASGSCPDGATAGAYTLPNTIYLKITFPYTQLLTEYSITPRPATDQWNIYSWTIQESTNPSATSGTVISTVSSYTWSGNAAQTWTATTTSQNIRCFILAVTAVKINTAHSGEKWFGIGDWTLTGY
ncbi:MAG: hypothetical protein LBG49_03015 [Mycoplasmataceae bacterium]|nr:hypothetical protein [Mycoplasmataceae bacterium]